MKPSGSSPGSAAAASPWWAAVHRTAVASRTRWLVTSTGPVDRGDRDKIPDDGWLGEINNDEDVDAVTLGSQTFAVCDSKHGGVRYRSTSKNVADGTSQGKTAHCNGDEEVIGGGVISHSSYAHGMYVVDTYNIPTNDGWYGRVHNWPNRTARTASSPSRRSALGDLDEG